MSFLAIAPRRAAARASNAAAAAASYSTRPVENSAAALDYKLSQRSTRPPPLPSQDPPRRWSPEESVRNILYNTPPPSNEPFKRHILNTLVQNEPGVLSRVSGILAARGFNIDSLVVCKTEVRDLSRMCITIRGQDAVVEQARRQLEDLVPVWAVLDYTNTRVIERELLLVKVSLLGPEYFNVHFRPQNTDPSFSLPYNAPPKQNDDGPQTSSADVVNAFQRSGEASATQEQTGGEELQTMSTSEALRTKHAHLSALRNLADQFSARIVDVSSDSIIIEMSGKSSRVDAFLGLVRAFGVLEAARSGMMVMPRTPLPASWSDELDPEAEAHAVDASLLPPG